MNGIYTIDRTEASINKDLTESKWRIDGGIMYFKHSDQGWRRWDYSNGRSTEARIVMINVTTMVKELDEILLGINDIQEEP